MTITARAVLKANRLFRELPDGTLDKLAALAIRRTLKRGARIFAQGDPGDALLGLIAGQVRISATTPAGKEVFLNIMEPGDSFGEIGVLDGEARTASAAALTDCELFVIRRRDLLEALERDPKLATHLIALLCRRLRWTSDQVEQVRQFRFLAPAAFGEPAAAAQFGAQGEHDVKDDADPGEMLAR